MIRVTECSSIKDKKTALSAFSINSDILLVPSLNDKLFWRNFFFQQTDLLTDESVQRASDFWQKLLMYVNKKYFLLSPALLRTILSEIVIEKKMSLQADTLYRLIVDFQDILYADDLYEVFSEWVDENIGKDQSWTKHLGDLQTIVLLLEERGWVTKDLLPAVLHKHKEDLLHFIQNKKIYISLDFSLSVVETRLLVALAASNDIHVLLPLVEPVSNFLWDYQTYKPLADDSSLLKSSTVLSLLFSERQPQKKISLTKENIKYNEFDTLINETLFVVGEIRRLLTSGKSMSDIAVLSTNKERYTLIFDTLFQLEGLHSQSTQDSSLMGVKSIQYLISKLKLKARQIEAEDLEMAAYYKTANSKFKDFSRQYTNIYEANEIQSVLVKNDISWIKDHRLDKYKFLDWLLEDEKDIDPQPFTGILNDIPDEVLLNYNSWVSYLQQVLQKKFLRKSSIHDGVIQVLDILESSLQENKIVFILGLNDKDLREQQNIFIEQAEIDKLAKDLGYVFPSHVSQRRLLTVLQILKENNQVYLSFSKHDVSANLLEPSVFHFLLTQDNDNFPVSYSLSYQRLPYDFNVKERAQVPINLERLSATQIESYVKCPFIYFAKNVLRLSDLGALDMDVDPMTNGNIIHQALAYLLKEEQWPNLSSELIHAHISKSIEDFKDSIKEVSLITSYASKAEDYILDFVDFEKKWRKDFPLTKTVGIEKEVKAYLDPEGYFHRDFKEGAIPFTAKLDRVDTDGEGNYLIIDYKFRLSSQHTNISSWFSKGTLQLAMYAMMAEDIRLYDDLKSVVGGIYFSLKPLQRDKGFLLKDHGALYSFESRKRNYINEEQKQAYYTSLRKIIKNTIANIQSGEFTPEPLQKKDCEYCYWRDACRAKHLN